MAELLFRVKADWEEVLRLRQELESLRGEITKTDSSTAEGAAKLEQLSKRYEEVNKRLTEMVDLAAKSAKEMGSTDYWIKQLEQFGDVSDETRERVEKLVSGLNSWIESGGKAMDAGNLKGFENAQMMISALTKELENMVKKAEPVVDVEEQIAEASEALASALERVGKRGIKAILDLPELERADKYRELLKGAGVDVVSLAKNLLPLKSNILAVGDAVAQALVKTPGGPAKIIAAVSSAVMSLAGIALKNLIGRIKETREAAAELRQISQEEISTFANERAELDRLTEKLSKAKEGSEEYQNTKNEIVSKFGKYDQTLTSESVSVDFLRKNYDKLAIAIQQASRERAYLASTEAISKRFEGNFSDALDNIYSIYQREMKRGNAEVYQNQYDLINFMIDSGKSVEEIMNNVSGFTDLQRRRIERNLQKVVNGQTRMKKELESARQQFGIKDTSSLYSDIDNEDTNSPGGSNGGPKGNPPEIIPEGSFAELKKRLSDLNKELLNATTDDARMAAQTAINAIEEQITAMEFRIQSRIKNLPSVPAIQGITGKATTEGGGLAGTRPTQTPPKDNTFLGTNWKEQLEVIDKAADALHDFGNAIGGVSGEVVHLAADTVTAFTSMAGGVKVLESGVKGLEKASAIFAIIGAAVKVLTAVTNIIKGNKEANEAAARAADEYARALEDVADKARLLAERNAFGSDTYGMFKAYSDQAKEAKKALEALGSTQKKITSDGRTGWQKFWGTGSNVVSVMLSDFYDEFGKLDVDRLSAWYDTYGQNLSDENKRLVEGMINEWERYEEALEGMIDYLSSLFGDTAESVAELMITSFKESGSALADLSGLADQFGENMAKSIITSMLLDSVFTPEKQEEIRDMLLAGDAAGAVEAYNKLLEDAAGMAPQVTEFLHGVGLTGDSYEQQATAGGFQTMSQDVASELNGRFTALQISNEGILQGVDYLGESMSEAIRNQSLHISISEDIRKIQADSYLALIQIRDNTEASSRSVQRIEDVVDRIEKNTRNL